MGEAGTQVTQKLANHKSGEGRVAGIGGRDDVKEQTQKECSKCSTEYLHPLTQSDKVKQLFNINLTSHVDQQYVNDRLVFVKTMDAKGSSVLGIKIKLPNGEPLKDRSGNDLILKSDLATAAIHLEKFGKDGILIKVTNQDGTKQDVRVNRDGRVTLGTANEIR